MQFLVLMIEKLFYFGVTLAVLISFHEFGHFYAARKLGVKVQRFSIGIGKSIWRYRKSPDDTEFSIGVLPLGGYVKMVDEREGEVAPEDLPYAFNRQSLSVRAAIVFAGPFANFLLAILLFWMVFMIGEVGNRPMLGIVPPDTLAAEAGFHEGDEIVAVGDTLTPTWGLAMGELIEQGMDKGAVSIEVRTSRDSHFKKELIIPLALAENPKLLHDRLGFNLWEPSLEPVVDKVEPNSAAEAAGLMLGDRLLIADGKPIKDWKQWVEYVRANPGKQIDLIVQRQSGGVLLKIRPAEVESDKGKVGKIGAGVRIPPDLIESMQVKYRLGFFPAFVAAVEKTWDYSTMTFKMIGRMLVGQASVDNLSGPISIADYAGQSANMGLVYFLKFLAIVSVSLAVLNLLPIPVLDGGHLALFLVEAIRGKLLPESLQAMAQNLGIVLLMTLMMFVFYLDIARYFPKLGWF